MMFQMTYLLCRNAKTGQWTPEFADPSASVVRQEKRDSYDRQQRKDLGFDKVVVCTTYAASAAEALLEAGKIALYATDRDLRRRETERLRAARSIAASLEKDAVVSVSHYAEGGES